MAAAVTFAVPAVASDDIEDFVGDWSCYSQTEVRPATGPNFVQIFDLRLDRRGGVTGELLQAQPGFETFPPVEFRCTLSGEASEAERNGRIALELEARCPDVTDDVIPSSAECIGSLRTRGEGYLRMSCIDLTTEAPGQEMVALNLCERQDLGRRSRD